MAVSLNQVPRAEKRDIAKGVLKNLEARAQNGPAEPALDEYIVELTDITSALDKHVAGNVVSDADRTARLLRLDAADDDVDTWYRHIESYLFIEGKRRTGPNVALALALHGKAFPGGLKYIDDSVVDENRICRDSLAVLRAPEQQATLAAIELPIAWLDKWETALDESDAAAADVDKSRKAKKKHVDLGRDAEAEWVEVMVRLRRYVSSRAKRGDTARIAEGRELLSPLLDALARMQISAASRATRRENAKQEGEAPAGEGKPPA